MVSFGLPAAAKKGRHSPNTPRSTDLFAALGPCSTSGRGPEDCRAQPVMHSVPVISDRGHAKPMHAVKGTLSNCKAKSSFTCPKGLPLRYDGWKSNPPGETLVRTHLSNLICSTRKQIRASNNNLLVERMHEDLPHPPLL